MRKFFTLLILLPGFVIAQKTLPLQHPGLIAAACTAPGTVPSKAIPVCGTSVFTQNAVTSCTGPNIAQPFCPSDPFASTASFWYKFTCFNSGSLGFLIIPNNGTDDYDWALFDVTGHLPDDVFTDPSLVISINGSNPLGVPTGCAASGTLNFNCYSSSIPLNRMENIIAGHHYLLMVTNYTNSGAGYNLTFSGSAVISDGNIPDIDHIEPGCSSIKVFFTADLKCNSITASGSELTVSPGSHPISSVTSDCSLGFLAVNSITVNFATPLPQGAYTLTINTGSDGNTYNNICDNQLPVGTNAGFTVLQPTANFILPPPTCLGDITSFTSTSDPLAGNTVASWHWDFGDGNTSTLQNPTHTYATAGSFIVKHWIFNNLGCTSDTSIQTVLVNPLPAADFSSTAPRCETRSISFTDLSVPVTGTLTGWLWDFGDATSSTQQSPVHVYAAAGSYQVKLTVMGSTNCKHTKTRTVTINARPAAGFIIPEVCLNDTYAQFIDTSKIASGTITNWAWNFGDPGSGVLNTSTLQNPQHSYTATGAYNVQLIVTSNNGCKDTIMQAMYVNGSFPVANFTVNNPATLCANDSVAIVNTSTVFPGSISKVEIYWDNVGFPGVFQTDNVPVAGKTYKHLYNNFQAPLTKTYTIRFRAYSGGVCVNDKLRTITINAAPKVQFNALPDTCLLAAPFQVTQASEIGGVPGSGVYSGPGISAAGIFNPAAAGVGTHTIKYTFTSSAAGCVDTMSKTITVLDTATAKFSYVAPICDGVPASFTDQSLAPPVVTLNNTIWDFGDGSPTENHLPGTTFTHLFPAAGTYMVSMHNTSAYGCNSTVYTRPVTVDPNHTVVLSSAPATANQVLCINTPITPILYTIGGGATGVIITNLPAGVSYTVTGTTVTISGSPTTTAGSPFIYALTTTGNTCQRAFASGSITVKPDHTLTLSSGPSTPVQRVCINTPITPIVYTIGGGATGVIVSGLPPGVNFNLAGNVLTISGSPTTTAGSPDNFSIITTGNSCIIASASGTITVSPEAVPVVSPDKPSYCIPNAFVTFNNASTIEDGTENALTYLWNFGDPVSGTLNTSVAKSPMHFYSTTGPFTVNLEIKSVYGCLHDTTFSITSIHPQPHTDYAISRYSICLGDAVKFTDYTNPLDGTTSEWHWTIGDGSTRGTPSFIYYYTDTLEFTTSLYTINSHACNSDTLSKLIKVYPNPTVDAGPDKVLLQDMRTTLNPVTTGVALQYLWTPNIYFLNNVNTVKNPVAAGIMDDITYTLTVTARGGCKRSDQVYIKILKPPAIPNTFSPNNDPINPKWVIRYLDDYPDCRVQVFTRTGQQVFESAKGYPSPWDGTYRGKPLPFDTYYYIIEPGYGRDPITGYVTLIK